MNLIEFILLFLSVLLGGGIAFLVKKNNPKILQLTLSFSGAYILGITVLHLAPEVFAGGGHTVGFWVLLGFLIQLFLEQFTGGVEHGHIHAHKGSNVRFALAIMVGLCVHAFIEGIPLSHYGELHEGHNHAGHVHNHNHLLVGVMLHKAPAAFALVLLLLWSGFSKRFIVICLVVFASMSPFGAIVSQFMTWTAELQKIATAIVIGSFLHISTTIIFEMDGENHRISFRKTTAILLGMAIAALTVLL